MNFDAIYFEDAHITDLPNLVTVKQLPVVWDGNDYATISYLDKPALSRDQVDEALSGMLGQESYNVLTRLSHDGGTGHVDLYADAIDETVTAFPHHVCDVVGDIHLPVQY